MAQALAGDRALCAETCLDTYRACARIALRTFDPNNAATADRRDLLLNCAEHCRLTAQALVLGAGGLIALCEECADLCDTVVASLGRAVGTDACLVACRLCAERCRDIAGRRAA